MVRFDCKRRTLTCFVTRRDEAFGLKYICLRYFNACGAHASGEIGERHYPESHLIPIVLQVPLGKSEKVYIFGDDTTRRVTGHPIPCDIKER